MRIKALAAFCVLSWATASYAQAPTPFKFEMHGFAAGTITMQDGSLNGHSQQGFIPQLVQPTEDKLSLGADVRQSRFTFSVTGPAVFGGATPKGLFELDWMGGYGPGNVGEIHTYPRLRIAYAELNWGAHRVLFGVNADLTAALGPVTLAHLGAPFFLISGNMGFRRPGVFGYHTFGDLKNKDGLRYELSWEIARAQWTDAAAAVGNTVCAGNVATGVAPPAGSAPNICAGEASGLPAVQARLAVSKGANLSGFIAGHWNKVDRNGAGNIDTPTTGLNAPLTVLGGNAGVKAVFGPATIAGGGYIGKNLAPLYGGISQSYYTTGGDVHEFGVWGQLGYNLTKEFSAWYFLGMDKINNNDLPGSGFPIDRSVASNAMVQYRDGGYAIGLEWLHARAWYTRAGGVATVTAANEGMKSVNQLNLTGIYYF